MANGKYATRTAQAQHVAIRLVRSTGAIWAPCRIPARARPGAVLRESVG